MTALERALVDPRHGRRNRNLLQITVRGKAAGIDRRHAVRSDRNRDLYLCHPIRHHEVDQLIRGVDLIHDLRGLINRIPFTVSSGLDRLSVCTYLYLLHDNLIQIPIRILKGNGILLRKLMRLGGVRRLKVNALRNIRLKVLYRIILLARTESRIRTQRADMQKGAAALKVVDIDYIRRIVDRLRENYFRKPRTVLKYGTAYFFQIDLFVLPAARKIQSAAEGSPAQIRTALKGMVINCRDTAGYRKASQRTAVIKGIIRYISKVRRKVNSDLRHVRTVCKGMMSDLDQTVSELRIL